MRKLKVGLFIDNYYPNIDGVTLVVDNLAKCLSKTNDVVVVAPYIDGQDDSSLPYKVIRLKSISVPFTNYKTVNIFQNKNDLLNENFDIIHIHSPFTIGKIGMSIAKKQNIPCISTVHTRFDFEFDRIIKNKRISRYATKVLISSLNKSTLCTVVNDPLLNEVKNYGYKGRLKVVYNGTDLKPAIFKGRKKDLINEMYNLKDTDNVFLFVGRIIDIKNIFFILEVLKLLKEENYVFKMIYVGDGPDFNKLKSKIKEYNLTNNVILTGLITDRGLLSYIYRRSDLLLFPSLFDTSSLVRIEASVNMTPGLFIKDSMVGSTITDNVDGYLSELDIVKYKDKIKEIMSDKKQLLKVSKRSKKTQGKSWNAISKIYNDLYIEEIERRNNVHSIWLYRIL